MKKFIQLSLTLLLCLLVILPNYVAAATANADLEASITGNASGDTDALDGTLSMTVKSSWNSNKNGTLTIKNNGTKDAMLSFSYTVDEANSFQINGNNAATSGSYNAELAVGASVTIYAVTKNEGWIGLAPNVTVSLENVKLEIPEAAKLTVSHNAVGTVSVGGTTVASGTTLDVEPTGTALVATPTSGAVFVGWVNTVDNSVYSTSASLTYKPTGDVSLKAIFASATSEACFWGSAKSYLFESLGDAVAHASSASNKTIVLAEDGTLPAGDYTIPSGITLLIPFDSSGTCYTTAPGFVEDGWSKPSAFYTLTMDSGAKIAVNGAISVSAKVSAKMGYAGTPTSKYGHIAMNSGSYITVNSGGNLYAWGYITGDGNVNLKSGATAYESFQVVDWRGGTASSGMLGNSNKVFPMTQYYVQNVEAPMVMESGAAVTCSMIADIISVRQVTVQFLGTSGCIFNLTSGTVTKYYDGTTDRLVLDIDGTFSISQTEIKLVGDVYKIKLSDYVLPIHNAVTLNVNSGTLSLAQDTSLLPGAQINIAEGSTMKLGSGNRLFVYDEAEWKNGYYVYSNAYFRPVNYAHSKKYTRTNANIVDAKILVNGTLDASAGYLYSTSGGGNICSEGNGVVKTQAAEASPTLYEATQSGTSISYASIPVGAAQLKHSDGTYLSTDAGTYNYSKAHGKWVLGDHTITDEVIAPTCTEGGYTTHTCVCGYSYKDTETAALGHGWEREDGEFTTTTTATCTEAGIKTYACTDCNATKEEPEEALGHGWEREDGEFTTTTTATCTTAGIKTFTCSCGVTKEEAEAALGHDKETHEAKTPTCNEVGWDAYETCKRDGCDYSTYVEKATISHTAGEPVVENNVDPTCGTAGSYDNVVKCTVCGTEISRKTVTVDATGAHTEVVDEAVEATCTTEGKTEGKHCSVCNEVLVEQETVDALGHTEVVDAAVAPTCTETGLTEGKHCSVCNTVIVAQTEVPANGHSYSESVTKAPTCTEAGEKTFTCGTCGDTYTEAVAATGHKEEAIPGKAATCTESGLTEGKKCTVCGETTVAQEEIPALGHTEEIVAGKAATCTETGLTEGKHCSVCNTVLVAQEVVAALGHTEVIDEAVAPSCTETGLTEGKHCDVCGKVLVAQEIVPATGHTEVIDEAVAPACTETGLTEGKHCSVCEEVLVAQNVVDALGHTEEIDAAVDATCTETGLTEGKHCDVCGEVLVAQTVVDALGHTEEIDAAVDATCTETGKTEGKHCSVCNAVLIAQETVAALGHTEVIDEAVAPTCTETGLTEGKHCEVCDEVLVAQEVVDALGHTEVIDTAVDATCTETGKTEGKHCDVCGKVLVAQEIVPATGHTEVIDEAVAPACTETGLTEGKHCSVCEEVLVAQNVVDALGHTEEIDAAVDATCTETGLTEGKHCDVCGKVLVAQTVVAALGHTEEIDKAVAPDCTNTGLTEGKHCSVCDEVLVKQETVAALGHTEVIDAAVAATCTETGLTEGKHCDLCGEVLVAQTVVDALGHTEVIDEAVAPDCTNTGLTEGKHCSVCGEVLVAQETVKALGHTEVVDAAVDATCTETGKTEGKHCSVCNEVLVAQEVVDALGHTEVIDAAKAPKCTETGLTEGKHCEVCGEVLVAQEVVPAKGHTEVVDEEVAPDCTNTGLTEGKHCGVCGEVLDAQEVVPAKGHTEEIDAAVEATCTSTGLTEGKHCSVCDEVLVAQETVKALGHTEVIDKAVAPDCTNTGLTEGKHCSVCNEVLVAQEVVDALGHTEVIDTAVDATCTETGKTEGKHCDVCGKVLVAQEIVPATGHTEVIDAAVAPDCTNTGLTEGKHCDLCGEVLVAQNTVAALGHNKVSYEAKAPTCTEIGWDAYETCSRCSYTTYKEKAALGHKWTDATYEAPKTCSVCKETLGDPLIRPIQVAKPETVKTTKDDETITEEQQNTALESAKTSVQTAPQPADPGIDSADNKTVVDTAKETLKPESVTNYDTSLVITLNTVVVDKEDESVVAKKLTYDVTPWLYALDENNKVLDKTKLNGFAQELTFHLPVDKNTKANLARVWHEETELELHKIISDASGNKYVVVNAKEFSTYTVESHEHSYTESITKKATCTEDGVKTYTCECTDSYTEPIPAAGHSYGTPAYQWTEANGGYTVTATVSCSCDYEVTETVTATYAVTTQPTTETEGVGTYTATFKNELFSVQTKEEKIPAIPEDEITIILDAKGNEVAGVVGATVEHSFQTNAAGTKILSLSVKEGGTIAAEGKYVFLVKYTLNSQEDTAEKETGSKSNFVIPNGATAITVECGMLGDTSLDGMIAPADATLILRALAKLDELSELQTLIAKTNGDDIVSPADATQILRYLAKLDSLG